MRLSTAVSRGRLHFVLCSVFIAVALTGCGSMSRVLKSASVDSPHAVPPPSAVTSQMPVAEPVVSVAPLDPALVDVPPGTEVAADEIADAEDSAIALTADAADGDDAHLIVAQAPATPPRPRKSDKDEYDVEEYDPWESFNESMFDVNRKLDRYILKPVAKGYDKVVPDDVQRMIANAFDNIQSLRRLINSLFQGKWDGAVREASRFMLNTTLGVGGLFDMARAAEIEKSREDFGQTLGFYGAGPGPYLILPLMEPLTVRDGIGKFVDGFFDPLSYFISFLWEGLALKVTDTVNDRSLNLELYQGFEETVIDMYSAVRHAYLERRRNLIKE